jgi:hypothetical protein
MFPSAWSAWAVGLDGRDKHGHDEDKAAEKDGRVAV